MSEIEKYRNRVLRCIRCGVCRSKYSWEEKVFRVCPAGEHSAGFIANHPFGRVALALEVLEGNLSVFDLPVDAIFECTLCANCRETCGGMDMETVTPLIDHPGIVKALRADMFAAGVEVPEGVVKMGEAVEKSYNIYGAPREERADWLTPDIKVATDADTIFFPGCLIAYRTPEIARATAKILNKVDIEFSILGEEEYCCGNPLIMTGQLPLAREVARHNYERLKDKRVITSCAGCYRCFEHEYHKLLGEEYKLDTYHIMEILVELIEDGELKFKKKGKKREKITYHDPCELGREMKMYDEPRIIIEAIPGVELVEMVRNRERTWCCGGGGGLKGVNFDMAVEIGMDKVKEALATGAKKIVSACPSCKININDAIRAAGAEAEIKAIDITELVVEAL
ncbi:(Fe-S)-binding protein [Chloroflexota bacterium]